MTLTEYLVNKTTPRWDEAQNGALDPESLSVGSHRKVWWRCEKGHSWEAAVYSIAVSGCGCPYCRGMKALPGETDIVTLCPETAAQWDHEKNGELDPKTVRPGSHEKVWWQCERGHSWKAAVYSIAISGCGCPYCRGVKALPGETDMATLYPEVAAQWDHEKNGGLDPKTVLPGSHEKVWWQCEKGHSWKAAPFSRTREKGSGCPYCTGKKVLAGFNDLGSLRPKLAREWYQPLNGDLSPADVTLGSNKKVWWRCADRHVWKAAIYSRTRSKSSGCPVCTGIAESRKIHYFEDRPRPVSVKEKMNIKENTKNEHKKMEAVL